MPTAKERLLEAYAQYRQALADDNVDDRLRFAREAHELGKDVFRDGDAQMAALTSNYGSALLLSGQFEDADERLSAALESFERLHGPAAAALLPVLLDLADASGHTRGVQVQWAFYKRFERAAIRAAKQFEYEPRIVDGVAVEVAGVTTRIFFKIEDNPFSALPAHGDTFGGRS